MVIWPPTLWLAASAQTTGRRRNMTVWQVQLPNVAIQFQLEIDSISQYTYARPITIYQSRHFLSHHWASTHFRSKTEKVECFLCLCSCLETWISFGTGTNQLGATAITDIFKKDSDVKNNENKVHVEKRYILQYCDC